MTPNDHRDISNPVTLYSPRKGREKEEEGGDVQSGGVCLLKSALCVMEL